MSEIAADDETTWSDELRDYLSGNLDVLCTYEEERELSFQPAS